MFVLQRVRLTAEETVTLYVSTNVTMSPFLEWVIVTSEQSADCRYRLRKLLLGFVLGIF